MISTTAFRPSPALVLLRQLRGALTADLLKLKGTAALQLVVGLATLPVLVIFLVFYFRGAPLLEVGQSPWVPYLHNAWRTEATLLLPLFIVLLTSLVVQVEHRASAWKHLHTQPVTRGVLFCSKLLVLLALSLVAQVLHAALLLLTGWLLLIAQPALGFQHYAFPLAAVATAVLRIYVGTAGILAVQYVASLYWRSFVGPMVIGLAGTILALTVLRLVHADLLPYGAPLLTFHTFGADGPALVVPAALAPHEWLSLGWVVLMLGLGPLWLRRRLA